YQKRRVRICLIGTGGCCAPIGEPPPVLRSMPPMSTLMLFVPPPGRFTGTVPTTGDGGMPPPVKTPERVPPHSAPLPITPEALSRFTAWPRASPRFVAHVPGTVATGRLVL